MATKIKNSFSPDFLEQVGKVLLEEKTRLEKELKSFSKKNSTTKGEEYDANFPEYGDEEDENAREVADYTANKTLEVTFERELRDVESSLKRLHEGNYGMCKYCDQPIDEKRLLARPTSSSCVACKKTLTQEA